MSSKTKVEKIDCIELEALVVMKIIKHCKESMPDQVTGLLLGFANGSTLEVTHSFPYSDNDDVEEPGVDYQFEMMRCLREVNVDSNTVGWYQSTFLGSYLNEQMIDTQFNYQSTIKSSVVIIYDPMKTSQGALSLQAFRLSDVFMNAYKEKTFSKDSLTKHGLTFANIFNEVPIRVRHSIWAGVLLDQLNASESLDASFQSMTLTSDPFIEKNLELLIDAVDELAGEQSKLAKFAHQISRQQQQQQQWLARRRAENASRKARGESALPETEAAAIAALGPRNIVEPSRLESLLLTRQLASFCDQLALHGGQAYVKRYMVDALHRRAPSNASPQPSATSSNAK